MGRVTAVCQSGLGNRVSAFIGGCFLAHKLNYDFEVVWPIDTTRDFRFNDLFTSCGYSVKETYIGKEYDLIISLFLDNKKTLKEFLTNKVGSAPIISTETTTVNVCKNYNNILYKSPQLLTEITDADICFYLKKLKIQPFILYDILNFVATKNINGALGYHFRHAPNQYIDTFQKNIIFEKIKNTPNKKYFICSDTQATEELYSQLPNVVTLKKKTYPCFRSDDDEIISSISREAAVEALKDVLLLSRTVIQDLIYPISSTFLRLAIWYQNISLGHIKGQKILFSEIV